ncbi:MAG: DNA (cytosine-5-)-methyltransferase [Desulfatiglandales bacterium]
MKRETLQGKRISKESVCFGIFPLPKEIRNRLSYIDAILQAAYGTPDLGNVADPLEELIFLTITQRTKIKTAIQVFRNLKEQFSGCNGILQASDADLRRILSVGGRGNFRIRAVRELLNAVKDKTGALSLSNLRQMNETEAFEFLLSLPWVGEKIARCVLLYSLGFNTFPADVNAIRIFRRTGILTPVIGSLEGIEHRKAQSKIAPWVPAEIARTLHVNMVVHGQEVCRERNPRCERCKIRKFCAFWRNSKVKEADGARFTMIDLFSGAGGISLGFHDEGFRIALAVDNDSRALQTYRLNHPWVEQNRILYEDMRSLASTRIRAISGEEKIDVLVAGVPCQGFSRVGYRTKPGLIKEKKYKPEKDPRNTLFKEVIRFAHLLNPRCILVENVPDMERANITHYGMDRRVIELLERRLGGMGYHTATVCLDATDFGIPQKRRRLFFVASKKMLPDKMEERLTKLAQEMKYPEPTPSLFDAIASLQALKAGEGVQIASFAHDQDKGVSDYKEFVRNDATIIFNHVARPHNNDDMRIIEALQPGENYVALVRRMPDILNGRSHKVYTTHNFQDKFYRLRWDAPCRTIVAHLAKDGNSFIHPEQNRALTVREAARIQSFPDDFIFTGSRTSQFIQVGNAVPPMLARVFARFFRKLLEATI